MVADDIHDRFETDNIMEQEVPRPRDVYKRQSNTLYTNWLNYYVYQVTPYLLDAEE